VSAVGTKVEAPRGWLREGVAPPAELMERSVDVVCGAPSQKIFEFKNGIFWCTVEHGFLADRTNGRAIGTVLRLSSSVVVVCL